MVFSVEQLLRHLQQVLETHEVNWKHVLCFLSTLLVYYQCAQPSLKGRRADGLSAQVEVLCVKGKRKTKFKEKSCTTFIPNQRSDIEINSSFCSSKLVFQRERSTVISVLFCVSDRAAVQTAELCIRRL